MVIYCFISMFVSIYLSSYLAIMHPHYSQTHCFWLYLAKGTCNPQINTQNTLRYSWMCLSSKILRCPGHALPDKVGQWGSAFLVQLSHRAVSQRPLEDASGGTLQCHIRSPWSRASVLGSESQLWPLLLGSPLASYLTLLNPGF